MPALKNAATGDMELVADTEVEKALAAGTHTIDAAHPVPVKSLAGQGAATSPEQLSALGGMEPATITPDELARQQEKAAYEEQQFGGLANAGAALETGALDLLSLGGFSALNRATDDRDILARNAAQHHGAYVGGQVVGAALTLNPELAAATPAGAVGRAARAAGTAGEGVGLLGRAAIKGGAAAAEGAVLGGGLGLGEASISEDPLTFEHVMGSIKSSAILGAVLGGTLGAGESLVASGWRGAKRIADSVGKRMTIDAEIPPELAGLDKKSLRVRRDQHIDELQAAVVPERAQLAKEIAAARDVAKAEKPWIAVEGFKTKSAKAAAKAPAKSRVPTYEELGSDEGVITRTVPLKQLIPDLVAPEGSISGRAENIRTALSEGKKLPPVDLNVSPSGKLMVNDGRHRLRVYQEQGVKNVRARFTRGVRQIDLEEPLFPDLLPAGARAKKLPTELHTEAMDVGGRPHELQARVHDIDASPLDPETWTGKYRHSTAMDQKLSIRITRDLGEGEMANAGEAQFRIRGGELYPENVQVLPGFQRQGLATKMYEKAEELTGRRIVASNTQTAAGKGLSEAFAARRAAEPPSTLVVPPELGREFREIGRLTLEADRALDRILRNPKRLAERPWLAEGPLQQSEHALDRLQAVAPELRARMAADAGSSGQREAALGTVDAAIQRAQTLQGKIKALTPEAQGGVWKPQSPLLEQIQAAEDALGNVPKPSLWQDAATGYAAGAMAGLTPGGPLGAAAAYVAPKIARKLSDLVFGRLKRTAARSTAQTGRSIERLLSATKTARPAVLPSAIAVLKRTKLSPPLPPAAKAAGARAEADPPPLPGPKERNPLVVAYMQRARELQRWVTTGPDGKLMVSPEGRETIADRLSGVAMVDPLLADRAETALAARLVFLADKLPRRPDVGMQVGPDYFRPSTMEMRKVARFWEAADNPAGVESRLADGTLSPEDAEAYRALYPERLADLTRQVVEQLSELQHNLPQNRKIALTILTGISVEAGLEPEILAVLQSQHYTEAGTEAGTTAPKAHPAFGSIKTEDPTRAQTRAS